MTKKEKELKILELFNLKIGDRIISDYSAKSIFKPCTYKITERESNIWVINEKTGFEYDAVYFTTMFDDWTKLEPSLKDKKCKDITCYDCPFGNFRFFDCGCYGDLREKAIGEIYNIVKQDLDKAKKEIFGEEE